MHIKVRILDQEFYRDYPLPGYETDGAAGMDLRSTKDFVIAPQERIKISTGIAIHLGSDKFTLSSFRFMGMVVPRSGLGTKGLVLANTVGIIDADYQGEIIISAWNSLPSLSYGKNTAYKSGNDIEIKRGDRIAQLLIIPAIIPDAWRPVDDFEHETVRGAGGFGSTDNQNGGDN